MENGDLRFNPHSHAGSDPKPKEGEISNTVSIHTPTRGVTMQMNKVLFPQIVSIHTPTRGVTLQKLPEMFARVVSIHTPTRGVTNLKAN